MAEDQNVQSANARFKHALAVAFDRDVPKIVAFLQRHGYERPDAVSEKDAIAMIEELKGLLE